MTITKFLLGTQEVANQNEDFFAVGAGSSSNYTTTGNGRLYIFRQTGTSFTTYQIIDAPLSTLFYCVRDARISPNGQYMVAVGYRKANATDQNIALFKRATSGQWVHLSTQSPIAQSSIRAISWHPSGNWLVVFGSASPFVQVLNFSNEIFTNVPQNISYTATLYNQSAGATNNLQWFDGGKAARIRADILSFNPSSGLFKHDFRTTGYAYGINYDSYGTDFVNPSLPFLPTAYYTLALTGGKYLQRFQTQSPPTAGLYENQPYGAKRFKKSYTVNSESSSTFNTNIDSYCISSYEQVIPCYSTNGTLYILKKQGSNLVSSQTITGLSSVVSDIDITKDAKIIIYSTGGGASDTFPENSFTYHSLQVNGTYSAAQTFSISPYFTSGIKRMTVPDVDVYTEEIRSNSYLLTTRINGVSTNYSDDQTFNLNTTSGISSLNRVRRVSATTGIHTPMAFTESQSIGVSYDNGSGGFAMNLLSRTVQSDEATFYNIINSATTNFYSTTNAADVSISKLGQYAVVYGTYSAASPDTSPLVLYKIQSNSLVALTKPAAVLAQRVIAAEFLQDDLYLLIVYADNTNVTLQVLTRSGDTFINPVSTSFALVNQNNLTTNKITIAGITDTHIYLGLIATTNNTNADISTVFRGYFFNAGSLTPMTVDTTTMTGVTTDSNNIWSLPPAVDPTNTYIIVNGHVNTNGTGARFVLLKRTGNTTLQYLGLMPNFDSIANQVRWVWSPSGKLYAVVGNTTVGIRYAEVSFNGVLPTTSDIVKSPGTTNLIWGTVTNLNADRYQSPQPYFQQSQSEKSAFKVFPNTRWSGTVNENTYQYLVTGSRGDNPYLNNFSQLTASLVKQVDPDVSVGVPVTDVKFHPNGNLVAVGKESGGVVFYNHAKVTGALTASTTVLSPALTVKVKALVFSQDGNTLVVATDDTNKLTTYLYNSTTNSYEVLKDGSGTAVYAPSVIPNGSVNCLHMSKTGDVVYVGTTVSPYIYRYQLNQGVLEKLSNLLSLPSSSVTAIDTSPDFQYLFVGQVNSPRLLFYKNNGLNYTRLTDPDIDVVGTISAIDTDPTASYISVGHASGTFATFYKRTNDTINRLALPTISPTSAATDIAYSPDGKYVTVSNSTTPYLTVYARNADTFVKQADPTQLPANNVVAIDYWSQ